KLRGDFRTDAGPRSQPAPILVLEVYAQGGKSMGTVRRYAGGARLTGHPQAAQLRAGFSEMLQTWSWTWFMTWTFEDCVGPQKALIEVRRHLEFIAWGAKGEIGYIAGLEQEYDAPSPHAHGLIIGGERLYMEPYWRAWLDRNGRGRFERVRSIGAV